MATGKKLDEGLLGFSVALRRTRAGIVNDDEGVRRSTEDILGDGNARSLVVERKVLFAPERVAKVAHVLERQRGLERLRGCNHRDHVLGNLKAGSYGRHRGRVRDVRDRRGRDVEKGQRASDCIRELRWSLARAALALPDVRACPRCIGFWDARQGVHVETVAGDLNTSHDARADDTLGMSIAVTSVAGVEPPKRRVDRLDGMRARPENVVTNGRRGRAVLREERLASPPSKHPPHLLELGAVDLERWQHLPPSRACRPRRRPFSA